MIPSTTSIPMDLSRTGTTLDGDTLYVGGSGPNNYTTIQSAIDDASNGDTVFVYDDSSPYIENISVDRSINLIGEDKNTTIIDGYRNNDVVSINANYVNIIGFTIKNSTIVEIPVMNGAGIKIYSNNNKIHGNILVDNQNGIYATRSSFNDISSNDIINNSFSGIWFDWYCYNNSISENYLKLNEGSGIFFHYSNNNFIFNNSILSNKWSGIRLNYACNNILSVNIISMNDEYGGIFIGSSSDNILSKNSISQHKKTGIQLRESNNNIITKNNFLNNKIHAMLKWGNHNFWDENYWNQPRLLPKPIIGYLTISDIFIPWPFWINFDWHPAQEPYDIDIIKN